MSKEYTAIAIDGPSGAGKSTLARMMANKLGFLYVDTGALYRTVGLHAINTCGGFDDKAAVIAALKNCDIEMKLDRDGQKTFLSGVEVGADIRTPEASMAASAVSAIPEVRDFLLSLQRDAAEKNNIVMDGRDIATVILPNAEIKIFLTATPEARAQRRYIELRQKNIDTTYDAVYADMQRRDSNDSSRSVAPLKPAPDAVIVDTTVLDLDQSLQRLLQIVAEKLSDGESNAR